MQFKPQRGGTGRETNNDMKRYINEVQNQDHIINMKHQSYFIKNTNDASANEYLELIESTHLI